MVIIVGSCSRGILREPILFFCNQFPSLYTLSLGLQAAYQEKRLTTNFKRNSPNIESKEKFTTDVLCNAHEGQRHLFSTSWEVRSKVFQRFKESGASCHTVLAMGKERNQMFCY